MVDVEDDNADVAAGNNKIWESFMAFDHEQFGFISVNDLRAALDKAGELVSEDETYWMISVADPENSG